MMKKYIDVIFFAISPTERFFEGLQVILLWHRFKEPFLAALFLLMCKRRGMKGMTVLVCSSLAPHNHVITG